VKGREVAIDTAPIDITARHQKKRDAAIIGGGAGGGAVLATKGKEVHLPSGTALKIRLKEPARIA